MGPSAQARPAPERLRVAATSFGFGAAVGAATVAIGAPGWAACFSALIYAALGSAVSALSDGRGAPSRAARLMRELAKSSQLLLIAFVVTSFFAMELRYDVVPNRYGFLELLVPVAVAAVLFDVSGGLFAAALTVGYAFQALAPPRFAPVLESAASFPVTLGAFALTSFATALFFAWRARALAPAGDAHELADLWRIGGRLAAVTRAGATRRLAQARSHVLPGAGLVLVYALFWATFATVSTGRGLHGDSLEAYAWGREFVFGYYKHPPFWSWVAGAWFAIFPKTSWSFWLLSELNGGLGLAGAWALIGRFAGRRVQMLGVLLLMLTPFYQFNAQRFNANTILLSLWPWTLYFFVRSLETRRVLHAFLCGLIAGCALLSKYFGVILVATCFLAALAHPSRQRYFASAAPYVSTLVAFLVFAPHLVWLFHDGFQPLLYLSNRIDLADRAISNHYFEFIAGNVAFFILPAAVLAYARWRGGAERLKPPIAATHGRSLLTILAFAPFVLTMVAGIVGHAALGVPFAVPIFALVPIWLVVAIAPNLDLSIRATRACVAALLIACTLAAPVLPWFYLRFDPKHHSEPRMEAADLAVGIWREQTGAPLRFVGGERDFALAAAFRSPDATSEFNAFNYRWSPWVTPEGVHAHGLLVICPEADAACNGSAAAFLTPASTTRRETLVRSVWGLQGLPWTFNIYVIPPLSEAR